MSGKDNVFLHIGGVFISAAIVLTIAWTTGPFYYHFADTRLVVVYSFIQLFGTAFVSFSAFKYARGTQRTPWTQNPSARPFLISAVGFLFLGFDDLLSIHENLDKLIHLIFRMQETPFTDHIDDVILLTYGIIALFFIKDFIREFRRHPYMVGFLAVGFLLFFCMFCLDFISNNVETYMYFFGRMSYGDVRHKRDILRMVEDSVELISETCFLAAFLAALGSIKAKITNRS